MSRVSETFTDLRAKKKIALVPFIPAGYPDLETTAALLPALERGGAGVIEVGIPFSDPIADGPTIQAAFTAALARGLHLADIFSTIRQVSGGLTTPLVAMVSYSIVYRYGLARFCADAGAAGISGLILPDLPPPEAAAICRKVQSTGLETTLLIAPTTRPGRRREIADLSSGFVYYLSVSGITGERDQLPADLEENLRSLRALTGRPVCVGFGIHKAEHLSQLKPLADGAIVGSAIVKRITQSAGAGPARIAENVEAYCRELLSLV